MYFYNFLFGHKYISALIENSSGINNLNNKNSHFCLLLINIEKYEKKMNIK